MVKFEEAQARIMKNIFVCRNCKAKIRVPSLKVSQGKAKCRNCDGKKLRPKRKKQSFLVLFLYSLFVFLGTETERYKYLKKSI